MTSLHRGRTNKDTRRCSYDVLRSTDQTTRKGLPQLVHTWHPGIYQTSSEHDLTRKPSLQFVRWYHIIHTYQQVFYARYLYQYDFMHNQTRASVPAQFYLGVIHEYTHIVSFEIRARIRYSAPGTRYTIPSRRSWRDLACVLVWTIFIRNHRTRCVTEHQKDYSVPCTTTQFVFMFSTFQQHPACCLLLPTCSVPGTNTCWSWVSTSYMVKKF